MTDRPLVTIVTPTLNRAPLLEATLRSVRAQTYPRIEHVVVDGWSTDGSQALLARYAETYALTWTSGPDRGMYDAINKGVARARGSIVAYLNSDDLYFPWTVESVVRTFEEHPEADFVFGDALNVEQESGRVRVRWGAPFDLDTVRRVSFLTQPAVFWRAEAGGSHPFDDSLRYVADCDFWMRSGEAHRFVRVPEFLAIERDHEGMLRERQATAVDAELRAVRQRYVSLGGPIARLRAGFDLARLVLWRRWFWASFTVRSWLGRTGAHDPWRELLATHRVQLRSAPAVLQHLPGAGRALRDRIIAPNSGLLTPP
jgi:glycosyltransferase involved in cell wall biosynthesis